MKEESERARLKLNSQKIKIMASGAITSWQIDGKKWEQGIFILLGSKITVDLKCNLAIKRCSLEEELWQIFLLFSHSVVSVCSPMNCSTPGIRVLHYLPELAQTHVSDAIQPSHPLSCPSLPAFNLSQHQRFFQWVSSLHQVAKYWNFRFSISPPSEYSGLISFKGDWSPHFPRDSEESSPTPQLKSINSSVLSLLYGPTLTSVHDYWKNHSIDSTNICRQSNVSTF